MGSMEVIIIVAVLALMAAPIRFALARSGFRYPLQAAIPASIALLVVAILAEEFVGMSALLVLFAAAFGAVVWGFLPR